MAIKLLIKLQIFQELHSRIVQLQMNRTVTNETKHSGLDREILTERYISPEKRKNTKKRHSKIIQKNINDISKNNKFVGHNTELTV